MRTTLLLSLSDLATLSRLVHASPVFHAQYLLDRKSILSRALLTETTDDVLVDGSKQYFKELWTSSHMLMWVCRHWTWMSDVPKALGRSDTAVENH